MKLLDFIYKLPSIFRNFYFLFAVVFIVWVIFFDTNDLINQVKLQGQYNDLEQEKKYYQDKIVEIQKERAALSTDSQKLEKFAREKYLMKKDSEDIYVVEVEK
jgi:cell division protein FtsB